MNPSFSPRALLLDLDGLMVDSEPLWFEVERSFARSRGPFEWSETQWRSCIGRGMPHTLAAMNAAFGIEIDEARDTLSLHDFFVAGVGTLALKPGCLELLDAAAGKVRVAVASSSASRLVHAVLGRFELTPRFDAIVTGSCVAHPKPAPDIYLEAARRLGFAPAECLALEDSFAGASAARAAGVPCIAVPEGDPAGRGFEDVARAIAADLFAARRLMTF